ncbi:MarR family winged helix-turn-helix transcriptional regulator [[Actinomadura] parvosata]|uniref:MarR family winged helix-turn-helix transcriptional regulator n=1 Tax=[Actinomadura] parvosata TaxID=1955412 RepID=UPI00406C7587
MAGYAAPAATGPDRRPDDGRSWSRAEQALTPHHESVLRGYELTMTQYTVLLTLSRGGGMSGVQLARAGGVTQQSMATVLTGMQNKGLIDRQPSPVHAKVMIATLTPAGRSLLDRRLPGRHRAGRGRHSRAGRADRPGLHGRPGHPVLPRQDPHRTTNCRTAAASRRPSRG